MIGANMLVTENDLGIINIQDQTEIRIGRIQEGNDWVLPHPSISAKHALLKLIGDKWWLFDLESDHGTFLNTQRVNADGVVVTESDTIWIAPYALKISPKSRSAPPKPAHFKLDIVNIQREVHQKTLLDLQGTPLCFNPGEFIAVVGGSGAGKSTFLKALLGMDTIPEKGRFGKVYFNNQLIIDDSEVLSFDPLRTIVGYVPQQDDSLHFQLSALEALKYSSELRFAMDVPKSEIEERVIAVLNLLRLDREEVRNKPISQLSGGQRKRVNIAMELVADPRILFLDEPTSGLDPGLDLEIMNLLKSWAVGTQDLDPKTIVLITHATENVNLCDYLVFLGLIKQGEFLIGGKVLYFGSPNEDAQTFFEEPSFSHIYQRTQDPGAAAELHAQLIHKNTWSDRIWQRARSPEDIQHNESLNKSKVKIESRRKINYRKTLDQLKTLTFRYFRLLRRDTGAFAFQMLQGFLVALLLWGVADADALSISGIRAAPTMLFVMSIAATWLGILNSTKEIVKERRIYGRERRYGLSAVSYVLSKFFVLGGLGLWQMFGLLVFTLLRFSLEVHHGTLGLSSDKGWMLPLELEWFITLEFLLVAGIALGLFISSITKSLDQATMIMFPAMLVQILLAGILFDVGPVASISFTYWGLRSLGNSMDLERLFSLGGKATDPILDMINFESSWTALLTNWFVLFCFTGLFLLLAIWNQSRSDKNRIPDD